MNIESSHAESKDTQEEGCQDPEETMFRPPLNISILFYLSEQVKTGIVCSFFPTSYFMHNLSHPLSLILHPSASCPTVKESHRLSKLEGAF